MGVSSQQVVTLGATPSLLFLSLRTQCRTRWLTRVGGRDVCVPAPGTWTRVRLCGGRNSADVVTLKTLRWGDDLRVFGPP